MGTKFGRRTWIRALMVVLGSLIFARSTVGDYFNLQSIPEEYGAFANLLGVALFVGAILWHFIEQQNRISFYENTRPNVVANPITLERPFHLIRGGVPAEILERYYIPFRNQKAKGITVVDTQPVHAIVFVADADCFSDGRFYHEKGFWEGAGEPWNRARDYNVTIKASGKPEGLCLLVRQQGGSDLFIFSDDSYISNFRTLEPFQDHLRIPYQKFYMTVRLIAGNLDLEDIWISVTNLGVDQPPRIIILSENPCLGRKL